MASQQTINRLRDYLRRHFEVEAPRHMFADRGIAKLAATFQAIELDLHEIADLVLREEAEEMRKFGSREGNKDTRGAQPT